MDYYLYRHIRLDKNVPFYIGIGSHYETGKSYHRAYVKSNRNPFWKAIVAKTDYEVEIMLDDLTHTQVVEKEKEFISLYKLRINGGTLCNLTLGGEGTLGYKHTEQHKARIRSWTAGIKLPEERKIAIGNFHRGKKLSEEHKLKFAYTSKGKKFSSERIKLQRKVCKKNIKVVDKATGIAYISISDAARKLELNRRILSDMLRQQRKYTNITTLVVVEESVK